MILEVYWNGLLDTSFGLSQFHGHGSWLVCELALSVKYTICEVPKPNAYRFKVPGLIIANMILFVNVVTFLK